MFRRCPRFIAGLIALLAFTLSFAGGAWASSMCSPDMRADASAPMASHGAMPDHPGMPGQHGSGHQQDTPPKMPPCPYGPSGIPGSCVAALLPAISQLQLSGSLERADPSASTQTKPHLIFASTLFHPPRA
ncbi:MAG TPA: hypothetical protein VFU47_01980 [Armatimonadota bacterium]|nr:hypothetical protein [Armatimonadota bacterium]